MGNGLSTLVKISKLIIGLALVGLLIYTIILIVQKKDMLDAVRGKEEFSATATTMRVQSCSNLIRNTFGHLTSKSFGQKYNIEFLNDLDFIIYVDNPDSKVSNILTINDDNKTYLAKKDIDNVNQKWRIIISPMQNMVYHVVPLRDVNKPELNKKALQCEDGYLFLNKKSNYINQYWIINRGQIYEKNQQIIDDLEKNNAVEFNMDHYNLANIYKEQIGKILHIIAHNSNQYDKNVDDRANEVKFQNNNELNLIMDVHGL